MNDPWQILILDRHTATERDVKAAYARLLKQHRPDSDPEGFRRVREAYEAALAWLRYRATQTVSDVSYVDNPVEGEHAGEVVAGGGQSPHADLPVVFEDFPLPAEAQEALAEVERVSQQGNPEQLEAALLTFHQRCEAGGVAEATRATALERAFQGREQHLAAAVSNSFLIRLAVGGHMSLPHLVISSWQEQDDRARLVQFSRALMDNARTLGTPEGAILLARVGVLTGLEQPEMASSLANAAYPHLPVEARQHLMAQLDQEAALGKLFAHVSSSMKPFWFKRLRDGGEGCDWSSPEARKAVNDIVERNRYVWEGWGVVKQLLPPANWAQVEQCLHHQAQQAVTGQGRSSGFPGWIIVPAILIIINMLRFMANDRPATRVHSVPVPQASSPATWSVPPDKLPLRPTDWQPSLSTENLLGGKKPLGEETSAWDNKSRVPVDIRMVPPSRGPNWQSAPGEKLYNPYKDRTPYSTYDLPVVPGVDSSGGSGADTSTTGNGIEMDARLHPRGAWADSPSKSSEPTAAPAVAPAPGVSPVPPKTATESEQLKKLLQGGALPGGVLNQPVPPMPGPLFQTR